MQIFRRIIINVVVDVFGCSSSRIDGGTNCCKLLSPRSAYYKITISSSTWNFHEQFSEFALFPQRSCAKSTRRESAHILRFCLFYSKTIKTAVTKTFSSWYFLIYALLVRFIKYLLQEVFRSNFGCCSFRSILPIKCVNTRVNLLQIILRMVSSSRRPSTTRCKTFCSHRKVERLSEKSNSFFLLRQHNCPQ